MICKSQVVQKDSKGRIFLRPCGQCLNCRINDSRTWYVRSHFELKKKDRPFQYFLTLTYNDENLPKFNVCDKVELKKFLNNLNTSFGLQMRYFATADYGSINNRCHYHAIILSKKKLDSEMVERIWKKGFIQLKKLTPFRVKYVLRYAVKKKMPFFKNDDRYFRLISKGWGDNAVDYYAGQEYFIIDGKKYGIPPYIAEKLGLDKKEVYHYHDMQQMILDDPEYSLKTSVYDYRTELNIARRRLK